MSVSWEEFAAGTIGGFVGKLVEFPMDTVKVILQTEHNLSTGDCIRKLYHSEGITGFYRGVPTPLLGSMAEISCLMTSYGFAKRFLGERPGTELPMWKLALAGGFAGVGVSAVLTPVELVKCRMQVQHSAAYQGPKYTGALNCIMQTVKSDGPQGLFRGMFGTLCREIPGNVAWFGVYELMASKFRDEDGHVAPVGSIVAGASAGVAYWTVPFPADTVKTRIQTTSKPGYNQHTSFLQVFKHISKTEGIRGLYRGWAVTALRAAPSNAAVFFAYELCMKAFTGDRKSVV